MKILVYAFASWGKSGRNISERVLENIHLPVEKRVLRVKFDEEPYQDMVGEDFDCILGLGQYPTGRVLRIEQVAFNMHGTRSRGYSPIEHDGPEKLTVDWELAALDGMRKTNDPGRFVCNYSMYQILRKKRATTRFAFIHIPKLANVAQVAQMIEMLIAREVG